MGELTMTKAEREAFLADVHVAVLSIGRDGGPPLVAPIWYAYEPGGDVVFVTGPASEKARLIEASGNASVCAQTETAPYKYVTVEGAAVVDGPADPELRGSLAHRYLGAELGDMYVAVTADEPSVTVRVSPNRWRTSDFTKQF